MNETLDTFSTATLTTTAVRWKPPTLLSINEGKQKVASDYAYTGKLFSFRMERNPIPGCNTDEF